MVLMSTLTSCNLSHDKEKNSIVSKTQQPKDTFVIYTKPSKLENTYKAFNSPNAINKLAAIENEYFNNYKKSESKYYGTAWYKNAINTNRDSTNIFENYKQNMLAKNIKIDSMHCTIYAIEALQAGFGSDFSKVKEHHKRIWKNREYAGWSIAYILTKQYNWKAYLMLSKNSEEYNACNRNFKKDRKYHVYKQPNIPIEKIFDFDTDKKQIDSLLNQHEFGWGFSEQGWHTWVTRFNQLKECNWAGSPSSKYDNAGNKALFIKTKFTEFYDYNSHIIVFPPRKE